MHCWGWRPCDEVHGETRDPLGCWHHLGRLLHQDQGGFCVGLLHLCRLMLALSRSSGRALTAEASPKRIVGKLELVEGLMSPISLELAVLIFTWIVQNTAERIFILASTSNEAILLHEIDGHGVPDVADIAEINRLHLLHVDSAAEAEGELSEATADASVEE